MNFKTLHAMAPSLGSASLLTSVLVVAGLSGCAMGPRIDANDHTPQELVAFMNSIHDHFYLQANLLANATEERTGIFNYKCTHMGGVPEMQFFRGAFAQENRRDNVQIKVFHGGNICSIGGKPAWGMALGMSDGMWHDNMFKANYTYEYLTPDAIAVRLAKQDAERQAIEASQRECTARAEQETAALRTDPRVGMQTQYGVIVDVRKPMVSIQFSPAVRPRVTRDIEWLAMAGLSSPTSCGSVIR